MGGIYDPGAPTVAKTQLVIDFIAGLGWDTTQETGYPLLPGPEVQTSPDKEVTLTPSGGPGYVTEEAALYAWTFQARTRDPPTTRSPRNWPPSSSTTRSSPPPTRSKSTG